MEFAMRRNSPQLDNTKSPKLPIAELIKSYNYPFEVYEDVKTEDEYLLTVYRIPHGRKSNTNTTAQKPVVLLMHGFLGSSADFLLTGPERALGFILSDRGYDVWLGNSRGGKNSRGHCRLDPDKDVEYWNFRLHELGVYDLPAIFNKITSVTNCQTYTYIGHSQGTTICFILLSEKPEYNKRINLLVALCPMVIIKNLYSIPYKMLRLSRIFWITAMEKIGEPNFPPSFISDILSFFTDRYGESCWLQKIVILSIYLLNGASDGQLVQEDLPKILTYFSNATSVVAAKHFSQMYDAGLFQKFDFGKTQNLVEYGTREPPSYLLSNVVCPVAMFCSSADLVSTTKDVRTLHKQLPNCVASLEIENPPLNHSDFIFGKDVVKIVYEHVFKFLNEFSRVSYDN